VRSTQPGSLVLARNPVLLTQVMLGDFTVVARTPRPDEDFGYLCAMINVAINAARNSQRELQEANEVLRRAHADAREREGDSPSSHFEKSGSEQEAELRSTAVGVGAPRAPERLLANSTRHVDGNRYPGQRRPTNSRKRFLSRSVSRRAGALQTFCAAPTLLSRHQ
jgi:hypothetical protein